MPDDVLKMLRLLGHYKLLAIGIALFFLGLVYALDVEHLLQAWTAPLDNILHRLNINLVVFGLVTCAVASPIIVGSLLFHLTDLRKSHITGVYFWSLNYDHSDILRLIERELKLTEEELAESEIAVGDAEANKLRLDAAVRRLDDILFENLRINRRRFPQFYQDIQDLETSFCLYVSFEPVPTSESVFEFTGFGIITDKHRGGRISECALVMSSSKVNARHNSVQVRGVIDRLKFLLYGRIVSIEMHQLIDPFNRHPDFRMLLKCRMTRRLDGWKFSEGVYFTWHSDISKFIPLGCTYNISK